MKVGLIMRPSILMLGPSLDSQGGIASVALELVNNDKLLSGCDISYLPTTADGSKLKKAVTCLSSLVRFANDVNRCDIVHAHFSYGVSMKRKMIFAKLAKLKNKKVIFHCHSSEIVAIADRGDKQEIDAVNRFFEFADSVIVMSSSWVNFFSDRFGVAPQLMNVVPNGIRDVERVQFGKDSPMLTFLFVGRIERDKGIDLLIDAASMAAAKLEGRKRVKIILAGTGSNEDVRKYSDKASELGVDCDFVGWADEERKQSLYQLADVFVLPSRREVFPVSILEAMRAGLPCIASDCGSIPDIIDDGGTGWLFPVEDTHRLAEMMVSLSDYPLRKRMGDNSRFRFEELFTSDDMADALIDVYERLCNE